MRANQSHILGLSCNIELLITLKTYTIMKKTILTLSLVFSSLVLFAQSEEEILNKWITTYNELSTAKNYDAMISNFEACRSEVPTWDMAYYYKGMAEFNKQNYSQALKDLATFTQTNQSMNAAYFMMGKSCNALSQPGDALTYLATYISKEPNDKNGYMEQATSHLALGQYGEYIEDLKKVTSIDGTDKTAYKNMASAYALQKDYNSAITTYDKAIELDPSNADLYYERATCKVSLKTPESITAALLDFNKSEELGLKDAKLYNYKYMCCNALKDNQGAIDACTKILEIDPNDLRTLYNRGTKYYNLKNYKEAMNDMDKIISNEKVDDKTKLKALQLRYMCKKTLKDVKGANADLELINKMQGK